MTYQEALAYLESFVNYEIIDDYSYKENIKLERMQRFASLLGDPHKEIRSLHIAGSKGKGSTAVFVQSILRECGYRVGLYTSPHLISVRERIRINDDLISQEEFSELTDIVRSQIDRLPADQKPSFFEVYTAIAFLYFRAKKVDFAVLETGLGGRLDATNIIEPYICGITPISLEHTDKLGKTIAEIAAEKTGIIKKGSVCVSSVQEKEALEVIRGAAGRCGVRLFEVGRDILFERVSRDDTRQVFHLFGVFGEYPYCETMLLGEHQVVNAALAMGMTEALRYYNIVVPVDSVRRGFARSSWSGRLEVIRRDPLIVVDGAQNRASARVLALAVKESFIYDSLFLIIGVSKDKDVRGICEELEPLSGRIFITKSKVRQRAMEPKAILEAMPGGKKEITVTVGVEEALSLARREATKRDLILVTGSLFLVGEAKSFLVPEARIP